MLFAALTMPLTAGAYDFSGYRTASPTVSCLLPSDENPTSATDSFCCSIVGFETTFVNMNSVALRWAYNTAYAYNHNGVTITLHDNADGSITSNDQTQFVSGNHCFFTDLLHGHSYTATALTICGEDTSHSVAVSFRTSTCNTVIDGTNILLYTPMYAAHPYSYHQMLFPVSQVPDSVIDGVSFKIQSGSGTMRARIYMANTDQTGLYPTNIVPYDDLQLVADSVLVTLAPGWVSIPFDVPFYSDGRNLVMAIHNISDSVNTCSWAGNPCENGSVYYYSGMTDSTNISDIDTMLSSAYLPAVQFHSDCSGIDCLPPSVMVTSVSESQIHVAWVPGLHETAWAVEYYDEYGFYWLADVAYDTGYTFTALDPDTPYQLRIGALCAGDTFYSYLTVRTNCIPIDTLPWHEDFNSYTTANSVSVATGDIPCWVLNAHDGDVKLSAIGHGEGHSLLYNAQQNDQGLLVLPDFDFYLPSLGLSFWTFNPTGVIDSIGVGYIPDAIETASYVEVDRIYCNAGSWGSPWQYHEIPFFDANDGRIALRYYGHYGILFIDDISVNLYTNCRHPDVSVGTVDATSIELHFSDPDSAYHYWVYYSDGTTIDSVEISDSVYLITGLSPDISYTINVSTICSYGNTSNPTTLSVTTACALITSIPYTCDFESISPVPLGSGDYPMPRCWSRTDGSFGSPRGTPCVVNGNSYEGERCLSFGMSSSYAVLPEVDTSLVDLSQVQLSFYGRNSTINHSMNIGVCVASNPSDLSTYHMLEFIAIVGEGYQFYQVPLVAYRPGMGNYIILSSFNGVSAYIDNLALEDISSCTQPIVRSIICDGNSATISWVSNGTDFSVYYRRYSLTNPVDYDTITVLGDTDSIHTLTLTGLTAPASYQVFIRAFCSDSSIINGSVIQFDVPRTGETLSYYNVMATSANNVMGFAECTPSGNLAEGTVVVATATPNPGYHFTHWSSGSTFVSSDNPYTFTVTSADVLIANFESDNEDVGIEPSCFQSVVGIHPNPTSTYVTITGPDDMKLLSVIDISGRTLYTQSIQLSSNRTITLDVSNFTPGTYFVRLTGPRQTVVGKLVVK